MSFFDALASKIAPYDCLGCGTEGQLLCLACTSRLVSVPERCYRCRKLSPEFLTCLVCCESSHLRRVKVATAYAGSAKDLIWKLKLSGAQAAARIMAHRLAALAESAHPAAIIVPVPTATSRQRQRGYDQAKLLARELARQTRLPYLDCLARSGQAHQHGASRRDRLTQLAAAFRVKRSRAVCGNRIILVDDVITTGATLETAAASLLAAGAATIEAAVFAQA